MENLLIPPETRDESLKFGVVLTMIQIVVYFAFILSCSYASPFMASDFIFTGVPVSFVFGLSVIACGVVLTIVYVLVTNKRETT